MASKAGRTLSKVGEERTAPSVAVLTVNTDGAAFMAEFAESLAAASYQNFQIVVVDNASSDDSLDILRRVHPQSVILENDANLGFTGACNRGIEYCLGQDFDFVLFLNGDVLVEPDFLTHLVAAADERTMTAPKSYLYHHPGTLDDSVGQFDWTRGTWKDQILGKRPTDDFDQPRLVDTANLSCLRGGSASRSARCPVTSCSRCLVGGFIDIHSALRSPLFDRLVIPTDIALRQTT